MKHLLRRLNIEPIPVDNNPHKITLPNLTVGELRRMNSIVRHFQKLKRLERQWVIDRLQDEHFHKLPLNP